MPFCNEYVDIISLTDLQMSTKHKAAHNYSPCWSYFISWKRSLWASRPAQHKLRTDIGNWLLRTMMCWNAGRYTAEISRTMSWTQTIAYCMQNSEDGRQTLCALILREEVKVATLKMRKSLDTTFQQRPQRSPLASSQDNWQSSNLEQFEIWNPTIITLPAVCFPCNVAKISRDPLMIKI